MSLVHSWAQLGNGSILSVSFFIDVIDPSVKDFSFLINGIDH
jgi:hypothetical protein